MSRGGPPAKIDNVLDAILEKWLPGFRGVCKEWEVVDRWREIVIGRVAEVTECSGVENGVLHVRVESASWRQDLTYLKEDIKAAIRRVTGCETIRDIMFY
jgi:predicted nucleic acid-binding Zn ribbon protein